MFEEYKKEIIKYGKISSERGLTPGYSGNISVRIGQQIVITATGTANGFLEPKDISVIDFNGDIIEGEKKASSEKFLHIKFYEMRPDINAILHFHSPCSSAFAASAKALNKKVMAEIVYSFGEIPIAGYALPGSKELVAQTSKYFAANNVILMQNHGVIAGGKDLQEAFLKLETCESYAKTIICAEILGGVKILPKREVEKIYSLKRNKNQ